MNLIGKTFTASACAIATAAFLSACGGGESGAPFSPTASIGYAVDGYLNGASVKCDATGVVVNTDSAGFFRFPEACTSGLTVTGGTNVDTKLPFTGTLKAPAGSKMVTPLTTLMVGGMTQDQINLTLGLPAGTDLLNTDPALAEAGNLRYADLSRKTLALQQLLQQVTEALSGIAGDATVATKQAIYSEVASAFAAGLKGGAQLNITGPAVDLNVLNTLISAALTQAGGATAVPAAAKTALLGVKADTVAAVISGALKVQADSVLGSTDTAIALVTVATKKLQSSTAIKDAVTAAGMTAILNLAKTDSAVVAKATTLADGMNLSLGILATAPTTTIPAGAIVIYSDAAAVSGLDVHPNWGQTPAVLFSEPTIAGNKSLKYTFGALYEGIDWAANPVDVSKQRTLHLDFWSVDVKKVKVSLISAGKENFVEVPVTAGGWNSVDIDLSKYTTPDLTKIIQIKLEPNVAGTLFVDNIYFHGFLACGTTSPTCAPPTSIPSDALVMYSDAAAIANLQLNPNWGQNPPVVFSEPTIAGNKSLMYTFPGPGGLYEGIDWAANPVDASSKTKLHIDFWTADVGMVKVSLISPGKENAIDVNLVSAGWNSVDIDLSKYTVPNIKNLIQIKLEPTVPGSLYVDNIFFSGTKAAFSGGIFASDYVGVLPDTAKSEEGGSVGFFLDSRLFADKVYDGGGVVGSAQDPGGIHNFYYGIGKPLTSNYTDEYFGAYVNAPGNGSADASPYAKVQLKFWGDAESWEKTNFTAQVDVVLQGPINTACTNPSGRPEITKAVAAQKIGAGSLYVVPKTDFAVTQSCGGAYTVDTVWSAVGSVVVRLTGNSNFNYVNSVPSTPVAYPTFLNMGPISFVN